MHFNCAIVYSLFKIRTMNMVAYLKPYIFPVLPVRQFRLQMLHLACIIQLVPGVVANQILTRTALNMCHTIHPRTGQFLRPFVMDKRAVPMIMQGA